MLGRSWSRPSSGGSQARERPRACRSPARPSHGAFPDAGARKPVEWRKWWVVTTGRPTTPPLVERPPPPRPGESRRCRRRRRVHRALDLSQGGLQVVPRSTPPGRASPPSTRHAGVSTTWSPSSELVPNSSWACPLPRSLRTSQATRVPGTAAPRLSKLHGTSEACASGWTRSRPWGGGDYPGACRLGALARSPARDGLAAAGEQAGDTSSGTHRRKSEPRRRPRPPGPAGARTFLSADPPGHHGAERHQARGGAAVRRVGIAVGQGAPAHDTEQAFRLSARRAAGCTPPLDPRRSARGQHGDRQPDRRALCSDPLRGRGAQTGGHLPPLP